MQPYVNDKLFGSSLQRFLCCAIVLSVFSLTCVAQPSGGKGVSQRFFMQVEDLLDLGFINNEDAYTQTQPNDIHDIMNNGQEPEYEFRIRTNEPFTLSIQTIAEDSSGTIDADSILQVQFLGGDNGNQPDPDDYKNVIDKPTTLVADNSKLEGRTFKIKYRAKPGATVPPEIKKLDLVFTASYP